MLQLKRKLQRSTEEGFTLLETLVAMLVATTFVAATMQAMVIAAYSRIRAQETSEATALIQEDLEEVKFIATKERYNPSETELDHRCDANGDNDRKFDKNDANRDEGLADGLRDEVLEETERDRYKRNRKRYKTIYRREVESDEIEIGKNYVLKRTLNIPDKEPYNVLELEYEVINPQEDEDPVAEMYTEVIPDAAFEC
ncbi:MAG: hypothetical protein BRC49_15725 [Cyanobacteria bacterium SW_10_48_33]|nr:MAG: hypothetical protein BRC49_15725 [Cyanobacteria bacterium SW_10_48_33]